MQERTREKDKVRQGYEYMRSMVFEQEYKSYETDDEHNRPYAF